MTSKEKFQLLQSLISPFKNQEITISQNMYLLVTYFALNSSIKWCNLIIFALHSGGAYLMAEIIPFEPETGNADAGRLKDARQATDIFGIR